MERFTIVDNVGKKKDKNMFYASFICCACGRVDVWQATKPFPDEDELNKKAIELKYTSFIYKDKRRYVYSACRGKKKDV